MTDAARRLRPLLAVAAGSALACATLTPALAAQATPEEQLTRARHRLEVVVEEHNEVREDLAATRARLAALAPQLAPMRAAIDQRRLQVGQLAASTYRSAASYRVGALLSDPEPGQLTERLIMVQHLTDKRERAIDALARSQRDFLQAQRQLATLAATQNKQRAQLAAKRRHIEQEIQRLTPAVVAAERRAPRAQRAESAPAVMRVHAAGAAGAAVRFALSQIGKPYGWGGAGPHQYDCSGLTSSAWRRGGRGLPHNSARQWNSVTRISRAQLRPGDLVFYYDGISHVGMYVGGGRIVHAPTFGQNVRTDPMSYAPIYGFGRP
ncbi:C40 family peptidase [Pilimelia columellifera]|uniref:NlpC/P60 domain-containing protein n=1 Tax=Pilimelia columellifera subsp. columellifera TaxID=706583 RepID=A0ABN3NI20_9ACTN